MSDKLPLAAQNAAIAEIVADFFSNQDANTFSEWLWQLYSSAVNSEVADCWDRALRGDMLNLYRNLDTMIHNLEKIQTMLSK